MLALSVAICGDWFLGSLVVIVIFYFLCVGTHYLKNWLLTIIEEKTAKGFPEVVFEDIKPRCGILRGSRMVELPNSETPEKLFIVWEPIAPFSLSGPRYLLRKEEFKETGRSGFELLMDLANNNS